MATPSSGEEGGGFFGNLQPRGSDADPPHSCSVCDFPIQVYGRLAPCSHFFCLTCAREMKTCPLCQSEVAKIASVAYRQQLYACLQPQCYKGLNEHQRLRNHMTSAPPPAPLNPIATLPAGASAPPSFPTQSPSPSTFSAPASSPAPPSLPSPFSNSSPFPLSAPPPTQGFFPPPQSQQQQPQMQSQQWPPPQPFNPQPPIASAPSPMFSSVPATTPSSAPNPMLNALLSQLAAAGLRLPPNATDRDLIALLGQAGININDLPASFQSQPNFGAPPPQTMPPPSYQPSYPPPQQQRPFANDPRLHAQHQQHPQGQGQGQGQGGGGGQYRPY